MAEAQGKRREFTDKQLRDDLAADLKPPAIAAKYGVSRQAVYKRIKQLEETTVAAAVAPGESEKHVRGTLRALEELLESLVYVKLLRDACDRWLREVDEDGNPTGRYDVGPRANEVMVTYWRVDERGQRIGRKPLKKDLQSLLDLVFEGSDDKQFESVESKHADPRTLILSTCAEVRAIVGSATDLARFLAEAERLEVFMEEMLAEIGRVSPEVRDAIIQAVRSRLVLRSALNGARQLSAGG